MLPRPQGLNQQPGSKLAYKTAAESATEKDCRSNLASRRELRLVLSSSYGGPVLERRRPGGTDLAIIGQGSQAHLSLPPGCVGVS